jgi:hypothetical protein
VSDALQRFEVLLAEIETVRAKLEASPDPDEAFELATELSELAKQAYAELERARAEAT